VTGVPDGDGADAELEELRADFPGLRISRKQTGERGSYIAHRIRSGVVLGAVEAASPAQLRMKLEPSALDASRPNVARVWDYLLGGKDNYAADRTEAGRLLAIYPRLPELARQNRLFLARAVSWLASEKGIRQFIDAGCGLPTMHNTHQAAQAAHPDCRVAYVDSDPVVVSHARALLPGPGVTAIGGDVADPDGILADPDLRRLVDVSEPVAVVLAMVLHFFDDAKARGIVAAFARAIAPGSYLVISVGSGDDQTGGTLAREYRAASLHNHSSSQIAGFLGGLNMVPPGLTEAWEWIPGLAELPLPDSGGGHILAGVARTPEPGNLPAPAGR
jgi:SAM-dependent methyltransferase